MLASKVAIKFNGCNLIWFQTNLHNASSIMGIGDQDILFSKILYMVSFLAP